MVHFNEINPKDTTVTPAKQEACSPGKIEKELKIYEYMLNDTNTTVEDPYQGMGLELSHGDTWVGIVEKHFPDLVGEGYSKIDLVKALKKCLAHGDAYALYKLNTSADLPKAITLPSRDEMINALKEMAEADSTATE